MSLRANFQIVVFVATSLSLSQQSSGNRLHSSVNGNVIQNGQKVSSVVKNREKLSREKLSRIIVRSGRKISRGVRKVLARLAPVHDAARYRFVKFNDRVESKLPSKVKASYKALRYADPLSILGFVTKKLKEDPITAAYAVGTIGFSNALRVAVIAGVMDLATAAELQAYNLAVDGAVLGVGTLMQGGFKGVGKLRTDYVKYSQLNREIVRWYGDEVIKPNANKSKPKGGVSDPVTTTNPGISNTNPGIITPGM